MFDTSTGEEFEPETRFDDLLDGVHESVVIAGIEFDPSRILREVDPIGYLTCLTDYTDDMVGAGEWSETDPDDDEDED
ncbi:hypothetical protein GCM10009700_27570 [Brevibacterium sanguinis]|uniref:hypothetical protein n=1 Tax=Brevibacterium sanguinis TaxID=232444 RepID=UPI0031D41C33